MTLPALSLKVRVTSPVGLFFEVVRNDDTVRRVVSGTERTGREAGGQRRPLPEANGFSRREQVRRCRCGLVVELVQKRHVVQDPKRPTMGRRHEIPVLHHKIVDRNHGKVELKGLPVGAIIKGHINTGFGARIEEPASPGSSRMTRVGSFSRIPFVIFVQVFP